jgi:D-alanine-D-alanine ligase
MKFGSLPETSAGIATRRVKWDKKYQKKHGIDTYEAKDLSPAVLARLDKLSRRIYRCLGLSGCARLDYRMTAEGQIYVIEANPNPNLAADEDFAQSAKAADVAYAELLEKLLALGAGYQAEWRAYIG